MPEMDRSATVARIVTEHPAAARVFQRHGIDYCCHGDVTVRDACARAGVEPEAVFAALAEALARTDRDAGPNPSTLSTAALVARIVDRHHGYLRRALPYIAPIASKVADVHGPHDARLVQVAAAFDELAASLLPHLAEEEEVLFPALVGRGADGATVARELGRMLDDHLHVGDLLARIRGLTDGFTAPDWACNTYRVLLAELEALEADILTHVHLENHVLAPRFPPTSRRAA